MLSKLMLQLNNFPVFIQVGCFAFSWIFLFFSVDAWFSPFYFHGYQIVFYTFVVSVLSSWLAYQAIFKLVKSSVLWDSALTENLTLRSCKEISFKDVCTNELSHLAKNTAESMINNWCDDTNHSDEFVKEVHNQIEDIFKSLSDKLSKVNVESFFENLILIVHNHLRNYLKSLNCSTSFSKLPLSHPVSRGEISLELYLDSLSHTVMKEFIPGSIQDCSAVFDLSCAAFCSQVLVKFVNNLSQPSIVLQAIVEILESIENPEDSVDAPNFSSSEENVKETSDISQSIKAIEDPLSGSSPQISKLQKESDQQGDPDSSFERRKGSPVLAGNLPCNNVISTANEAGKSSWIRTGLCSSFSTATAPLLPSQAEVETESQTLSKPNSLPLLDVEDNGGGDGGFLVDADVSPVYEDVEDFATAIAKLRSLLEQRVSTNGVDSSCSKSTILSPSCETRAFSSGAETESSFEELTEASELPSDSRIFFGLKIPRTEICTLPGEGQHYFYCIVFDGIYSAVSTSSCNNGEDSQKDSRLVLKNRTVRRRFRQFLQLHSQLEASDDPVISQAIRSIRGPSKWLNLPLSRLDQNTVAHRQVFLERYMQQLCNSPVIGVSGELRNFLDYELHLNEPNITTSNAAFNRVPFFAKTVSGVLQSIKTALPLPIPGFDNDQNRQVLLVPLPLPSPTTAPFDPPEREGKSTQATCSVDEVDSQFVPVPCRITFACEESRIEQLLSNWNQMDSRIESAYEAFESHLWRSELNIQLSHEFAAPDGKVIQTEMQNPKRVYNISKGGWDRFDHHLPLSSSIIDLLLECMSSQETWLTKAPVPLAVKIVAGKKIEHFFQESLLQLTNPNTLTDILHSLRQKLYVNNSDPIPQLEDRDAKELVRNLTDLIYKHIPGFVIKLVGEDVCTDVLNSTLLCLADAQLNRDLVLTLLDFLFLQICGTISYPSR